MKRNQILRGPFGLAISISLALHPAFSQHAPGGGAGAAGGGMGRPTSPTPRNTNTNTDAS